MLVGAFNQGTVIVKVQSSRRFVSSSTDHRPLYHISLHISTQDIPKHLNSTDPVSELTALNLAILNTLWLPDVEIRCRGGIYLTSKWCCISRDTSGISRQNSCLESFNSTENLLLFTTSEMTTNTFHAWHKFWRWKIQFVSLGAAQMSSRNN